MKHSTTKSIVKRIWSGALVAAFWLLVWELVYLYVGKEILVVSPFRAARRLFELSGQPLFWRAVGATGLRVMSSFLLSLAVGAALAVASFRFRLLHALLRPLFNVIKSTPVASFIILALIWMSSAQLPGFIAFVMVTPLVWSNLYAGLGQVDAELLEMAKIFRFNAPGKVRLIYLPALMPYFIAACSTGLGFAWKSAIAAEVICHPKSSIGTRIYDAKIYLETPDLFAWTIAVVVLSVLLENIAIRLLRALSERLLAGSAQKGAGQ